MKRLIVLGAGAIGGGLGGCLSLAGIDVGLIARGAHAQALRQSGLTLRFPDRTEHLDLPVWTDVSAVDWRPDDTVLVATKLGDAEAAYASLGPLLGPHATVVVAQNGLVASAWARQHVSRVVDSFVWVPAEHLAPGVVDLYGAPVPGAVDLSTGGEALAAALRAAGLRSCVRTDLVRWQRAKWMTNLCGLAVAHGRADWASALMAEGRQVLDAAGLDAVSPEDLEAYIGDIHLARIEGRERLPGGSTAQSLARGRTVETPWLNGPLVALAQELGVSVPFNERVCAGQW